MKRGFTLVEMLIVIGLIAMMGGMIVVGSAGMLRGLGERPVPEIFRKAVREARYQAAYHKDPVELIYNEENASFEILNENAENVGTFKTAFSDRPDDLEITFFEILPGEGLDPEPRENPIEIELIRFLPDRSSTPFEIEYNIMNKTFRQRYDPFSHIVIEDSRDD